MNKWTIVLALFLALLLPLSVSAATVGSDSFTRSVTNGWGTADTGGAYTLVGNNSNFRVTNGKGTIDFTFAGITREAYLGGLTEQDVDITTSFSLSGVPTGGGYTIDVLGRRVNANNSYRTRAEVKADGSLILRLIAQNGGAEQVLSSFPVTGSTVGANDTFFLRTRYLGINPTVLDAKIWKQGAPEPGWDIQGVENTVPALQTGGSVGIRASSSSDSNTLTVSFDDLEVTDGNLVNAPPVVEAGADQIITLPGTAPMAASVDDDDFPANPLVRTWSQVSGPGVATFSPGTSVEDPVVSFSETGTYVLQLTATDGDFSDSDTVTVTVGPNTAPVVNAGSNQTILLPGNTAALNATVTDNVPAALSFEWSVQSAPSEATSQDFSFSNAAVEDPQFRMTGNVPGTYILRLTVTDNNGQFVESDTVSISLLLPENLPPVVDAGMDTAVTLPDTTIQLSGSVTDDGLPVNGSISHTWAQLSGPATAALSNPQSLTPTVTFSETQKGPYVFELTASDGSATTKDTVIVIFQSNGPPVVDAGLPQIITLPNTVFLNATVTDDGKVTAPVLVWSKVSGPGTVSFGPAAHVEDPQVTFSSAGVYVLRLEVSDGEFSRSDTVEITVEADPSATPTPPPDTPVYRFYSTSNATHFYTASAAERDHIIASYPERVWKYEGPAFGAYLTQEEGTVPIYRFYSRQNATHFYTASAAERDYIIARYPEKIWKYEGIAWYSFPESAQGYTEVHRFWNTKASRHFYTASRAERDAVIRNLSATYRYEGVAWKVR